MHEYPVTSIIVMSVLKNESFQQYEKAYSDHFFDLTLPSLLCREKCCKMIFTINLPSKCFYAFLQVSFCALGNIQLRMLLSIFKKFFVGESILLGETILCKRFRLFYIQFHFQMYFVLCILLRIFFHTSRAIYEDNISFK